MKQRLTLAMVGALCLALIPSVALANGDESALVSSINSERASAGVGPLTADGNLAAIARAHSESMAAQGEIFHSSDLGGQISGWFGLAENVGVAASASSVHTMLMNSSGHRANILNGAYDTVGVGAVWSGGLLWVTQIFVDSDGVTSSPPPEPSPPPAPEPPAPEPPAPTEPGTTQPDDPAPATPQQPAAVTAPSPQVIRFNWDIVASLLPEDSLARPSQPRRIPEILERASVVEIETPILL